MTQRLGLGAAVVLWGPGWRRAWSLLLCSAWTSIKVSTAFTKISVFKFPIISQMPACLCTSLMVPTLSARMGAPLASLGVLSLRNLTLQPKRAFGKTLQKSKQPVARTHRKHTPPRKHTRCAPCSACGRCTTAHSRGASFRRRATGRWTGFTPRSPKASSGENRQIPASGHTSRCQN